MPGREASYVYNVSSKLQDNRADANNYRTKCRGGVVFGGLAFLFPIPV